MRHARGCSRGPWTTAFYRRAGRARHGGRTILGAVLAAVLATGGLAAAGPAFAEDEAVGGTTETAEASQADLLDEGTTGDESATVEEALAPEPVEEPADEPAQVEEPVEDPAEVEEPVDEPAEVKEPAQEPVRALARSGAGGNGASAGDDAATEDLGDISVLADTPGPGPAPGDLSVTFRAASPSSYTTADPSTADSSNVVTQLTSAGRTFQCGDTIVYYQVVTVGGSATGESVLTVRTNFDTRFGNSSRVGITEVTAFLAKDDSRYLGDEEETISGTSASGTWSDGQLSLVSTVDDVEAGDQIVVEYHATLTCGNPPGTITGNLQAASGGMTISQNAGTGPSGAVPGAGSQTVPLFGNAVRVAIAPLDPTVTQAVCTDGVLTPPTLEVADGPAGITYSVSPAGPYEPGQTVTVTATLASGFVWPTTMPSGWTRVTATTATYTVTFDPNPCTPVSPAGPSVTESVCVDGAPTAPTLTLATTEGVTYSVDPAGPYEPGQEVTVTAELQTGYVWGDLPEGWVEVDATTATLAVTFAGNPCTPVSPAGPSVTESVCEAGAPTAPTLTLAETEGVTYSVDPEGPFTAGQEVTVTAVLADGYEWGDLPEGWVEVDATTATLAVTFAGNPCTPVSPQYPDVTESVCVGGMPSAPTLTLATTEGVTYSVDPEGPYVAGQAVTVTAVLAAGYEWGDLPDGWDELTTTTAERVITFDANPCIPVSPEVPQVEQSECVAGEPTMPTLTLATTSGVDYSADPEGPYEPGAVVTVTAVLQTGYEWGDLPSGWELVDATTAEYEVVFDGDPCTRVVPQEPEVTESVCVDGAPTAPTLAFAATDGVTYSVDPAGPYEPGQEVTVTAELQAGYGWGDLPEGWVEVDATTATLAVTFAGNPCTPVSPAGPSVTESVCEAGAPTAPTLAFATTEGVTYSVDPAGPYEPGQEVTVTAVLADGYEWGGLPEGWVEVDATTATLAVTFAGNPCTPVSPQYPDVTESVCVGGMPSAPTLAFATTEGVTYSVDPEGPYVAGQAVTVTAVLDDGYEWGGLPEGWVEVDATTVTLTLTFAGNPCTPVGPQAPVLTESVCTEGAPTAPTLTLAETAGITYAADPAGPYAPGDAVTVTAELQTGYEWADPLPDGWERVDATRATYTVTFADNPCVPASPAAPVVAESVCVDGAPTAPTLTVATTEGIEYSLEPAGPYVPGQTVTVTAVLESGYEWGTLPGGWEEVDPTTAELDVTFAGNPCIPVIPVAPGVDESVCVNGEPTAPTLTPATTEGITYSVDPAGPYEPGQEVTVTAVLDGGYEWGDLPEGWVGVDATTATYDVTFAGNPCRPVTPAAPDVTQAVCEDGQLTPPTLVLPEDSDAITYTADPEGTYAPGQTVTVTATLDGDTSEWGDLTGTGWTETSPTTATLEVTFDVVECEEVMPVAPTVTQSVCEDGQATVPTLVLAADTEAVTYSVDAEGPYEPGQTVVVTATLTEDGFAWGTMPEGWEQTGPTTATFEVVLDDYPCTPASPAAPAVEQAVCVGGELVAPTLSLGETAGVAYSVDAEAPYAPGQTVTVTATLDEGYEWGELPEGWLPTEGSSTEATFTVTFDEVECTDVMPVTPAVTQAVCVDGMPTAPTLVLADGPEGVTYAVDAEGPYEPGATVVVTATLGDGHAWAEETTAGWEKTGPTTATYAVTFDDDPCIPASPVPPTVTQSQCPDGTVTRPTLTLPSTTGLAYSASPAGPYSGGDSVTVTASLADGYAWGELAAGWTTHSPTATYEVTFAGDAECPKPPLPVTGPGAVGTYVALAVMALLAGGVLLLVSRRRDLVG